MRKHNEDVSKLPVWAQRKLEVLSANVQWLREQLRKTEEGESEVWYDGLDSKEDPPVFLPPGSKVTFRLSESRNFGTNVQCFIRNDNRC